MPRNKKNYSKSKSSIKYNKNFVQKNKSKPKFSNFDSESDRKRKNFKFIKRSKEAEEIQRKQKLIEDRYKKRNRRKSISDEEDTIEKNAYEQLLSTFQGVKYSEKKLNAIESSSDSEQDEILDDEESGSNINSEEETDTENAEEMHELSDNELIVESNNEEEEEESSDDEKNTKSGEINKTVCNLKISDPFSIHFENELRQEHIDNLLSDPPVIKESRFRWPTLGYLECKISKSSKNEEKLMNSNSKKILLDSEEHFASEGETPFRIKTENLDLNKLFVKSKIISNATKNNEKPEESLLTSLQCELFSIFNNYQDFYYSHRNFENAEEIRYVYCLHALNHILKTRSKVLHHNAKLLTMKNKSVLPDSFRDQGLVRPKILIILPFCDSALRTVNFFISLFYGNEAESAKTNGNVLNYKRFLEEYSGNTIRFPKTNPKPDDYEKTFSGNTDDSFRIGISFTKNCIKLYSDFYSSDILIGSPLGLRMIIGGDGEESRDYDFLTSIEMLIMDQAELFVAQNWDHALHVLKHLHLQPKTTKNTDFSRVRSWSLNGFSRFYRQTLLFSSHELPEFRSIYNSRCINYRGKIKTCNEVEYGTIRNVITQIPQIFHKIDAPTYQDSFDIRMKYFITEILPQYRSASMAHCMIYVPSYFDFVKLRNYFKSESLNMVQICEYTKDSKIARARDMFFHSSAQFLLYSERAHFFRRTRIKGIRHLIMYQPPVWPHFYSELINLMHDSYQNPRDGMDSSMSVTVLYTKYDLLQISSIIGSENAKTMFQSEKTTHMFINGDQ